MVVARLWRALMGMKSPVFSINMDLDEDVDVLKKAIKDSAPDETAWCSAKDLQLFVAKTRSSSDDSSNSEWIKLDRATGDALRKGLVSDSMRAAVSGKDMRSTETLQCVMLDRYNLPVSSRSELHVLVVVPKPPPYSATTLGKRNLSEVRDMIDSPSSFAQCEGHGSWAKRLKKFGVQIECHRGIERADGDDANDLTPLPPVILNETFARFGGNCRKIAYGNEDAKKRLLRKRGTCWTSTSADFPVGSIRAPSSSSGVATVGEYVREETRQLLLRLERRLQKGDGDGGDPTMQNVANYIKDLPDCIDRQLPCLLVDICGPLLSIFGVVNFGDEGVICEPLVVSLPLLHFDNEWFMTELICACASMKVAVHELTTKCSGELAPRQLGAFDLDRSRFPYKDTCELNGATTKLHWSFMIIEKLNLVPLAQAPASGSDGASGSSPVWQQLLEIKNALESAGFVHGDLRGNNVMWDPEKKRVVLIDFDWAGKDGVDKYPPFVNSEIAWPPGAETAKPLRAAHDGFFVDAILAKLEAKRSVCDEKELQTTQMQPIGAIDLFHLIRWI